MVATAPRYVPLVRFQAALLRVLPSATSARDTALTEILVSTEAAVDAACNRTFDPAPDLPTPRTFDLPPYSVVYLDDVVAVTAVSVRGGALTSDEWALLPKCQERDWCRLLRLGADGRPLEWAAPFTGPTRGQLVITARWGFAATVPACVSGATLRGAITQYRQQPYLYASGEEGDLIGGGEPPAVQLTPDVLELLAPVTRPRLEDAV
jgi:hypothetical protein